MGSPVKDTAVLPPAQRVPPMPVLTSMKDDPDRLAGAAAQEQSMLSAWGATFVCSNACIGAGVLAFPNVFANGGLTRQRPHWWRHRVRVWDRLHAHQVAILDHVLDKRSHRHAGPGEGAIGADATV